jgi:hypothetical protein
MLSVDPHGPLSNQQFFIRCLQGELRFVTGLVARGQTSRSWSLWTQVVNDI